MIIYITLATTPSFLTIAQTPALIESFLPMALWPQNIWGMPQFATTSMLAIIKGMHSFTHITWNLSWFLHLSSYCPHPLQSLR